MRIPQRVRPLANRPTLCAGVVVILGLALGLSAATFGVVRATIFVPAQAFDGTQVFAFVSRFRPSIRSTEPRRAPLLTPATVQELARNPPAPLTAAIGVQAFDVVARFGERAERVRAESVVGDYQRTLGLKWRVGRFLDDSDAAADASHSAVVSDRLWREWFAPARATLRSSRLLIDGQSFDVIGVAPPGFRGIAPGRSTEVWLAGRVRAGASAPFYPQLFVKAPAGLTARTVTDIVKRASVPGTSPLPDDDFGLDAVAVNALRTDPLERVGWIILAFGGLLSLVGIVNVLNLLQVFFSARIREFATRQALGASAASIGKVCLGEIAILVAAATTLGLVVVWVLLAVIDRGAPLAASFGRAFQSRGGAIFTLGADGEVVAYVLVSGLLAASVLSASVGLRVLKMSSTQRLTAAPTERPRFSGRRLLLALQVAVATLLMMTTATFMSRMMSSLDAQPVVDAQGIASTRIDLSLHGYGDTAGREFYERLLKSASAKDGVRTVALADGIPGYAYVSSPSFQIVAEPQPSALSNTPRNFINGSYAGVSEGFFEVMRLPIVSGRGILTADGFGAPLVAVISQSAANRLWPSGDVLGQRIMFGKDGHWRTVVGVSADPIRVRNDVGAVCRACVVFVPFQQQAHSLMVMLVRSTSLAEGVALLRDSVRQANPDVIPFDLGALDTTLLHDVWRQRSTLLLVAAVGFVALLIAAAGMLSAVRYIVDVRAFEMAVRAALGATPRRIIGLVLAEVRLATLVGLLIGVTVVAFGERGFAAAFKGFLPNDLWTWGIVLVVVPAVTLGAGYLPAHRSTRSAPARLLSRGDS